MSDETSAVAAVEKDSPADEKTKQASEEESESSPNTTDKPAVQKEGEDVSSSSLNESHLNSPTVDDNDGDTPLLDMSSSASLDQTQPLLEHKLQPGDHVIRWEMLPIAWPIQIHGIVLEASSSVVVLADFGLTASSEQSQNSQSQTEPEEAPSSPSSALEEEATETEESTTEASPDNHKDNTKKKKNRSWKQNPLFSSDPKLATKELETKIKHNFQKLHPTKHKERITIKLITSQQELKMWKKVNYGRKFLGFGDDGTPQEGEDDEEEDEDVPKKGGGKFGKLFSFRKNSSNLKVEEVTVASEATEASTQDELLKEAAANKKKGGWFGGAAAFGRGQTRNGPPATAVIPEEEATTATPPDLQEEEKAAAAPTEIVGSSTSETKAEEVDGDAPEWLKQGVQQQEDAAPPPKPAMNPAMAKLLAGQKNDSEPKSPSKTRNWASKLSWRKSSSAEEDSSEKDSSKSNNTNKNNELPKSDPTQLVLARTRWLLEQGESILPPYHVFHSNSECIAVFCKTGRWSTLQAAVFLHSTGICNAKSTFLATAGVAAAMPLALPAMAAAGIAVVGAPYWFLKQSKDKTKEIQQHMNDAFWAQADPQVFVECIEHWCKLDEYWEGMSEAQIQQVYNSKPQNKKQTETETAVGDDEEEKKVDAAEASPKEQVVVGV